MRAEVPLAGRAQYLKVLAGHDEHAELHDGVEPEAVRGQAGAQILERELGLLGEDRGNRPVGPHADLARDEHELGAGRHDGRVRVRADRRMHVAGIRELRHRQAPRSGIPGHCTDA